MPLNLRDKVTAVAQAPMQIKVLTVSIIAVAIVAILALGIALGKQA